MGDWLYFYQHIPEHLSPTISFGSISIGWYSLMYLAGFLTIYCLLRYRIKKGESAFLCHSRENGNPVSNFSVSALDSRLRGNDIKSVNSRNIILNFLLYAFIGLAIGARLGYVFFYNFSCYWHSPLSVISPFDLATGKFTGIYGLSYHGGLAGIILASWMFARKFKINFRQLADFVVPAIPAGYFFGRIGNFLNGELYGRVTDKAWGMYFPGDPLKLLRHPSQLYEATLEGLILFLILWKIRNSERFKNKLVGLYISGYASVRIISEFFREPDEQIGFIFKFLTLGQILSLIMLFAGIIFILYSKNKKDAIISKK